MKHEKTDNGVRDLIIKLGYSLNRMSGVKGEYYTTNREEDLLELAREIILEREEDETALSC